VLFELGSALRRFESRFMPPSGRAPTRFATTTRSSPLRLTESWVQPAPTHDTAGV
jgi:hypothetical protein